ncbi:hypothetical protein EBB07_00705 [Paenibacillaceae bacterium]|nr:hypothetical protein EBB07_00705 [Paenibacillaceae bacterium]
MIFNMLLRLLLLWGGGGYTMALVTVFATLIIAGRRTFAQVPATLQQDVEVELAALGLNKDGRPE